MTDLCQGRKIITDRFSSNIDHGIGCVRGRVGCFLFGAILLCPQSIESVGEIGAPYECIIYVPLQLHRIQAFPDSARRHQCGYGDTLR